MKPNDITILERVIPQELWSGIGTRYVLSGGTIRNAPGYPNAGAIVRHFIYPQDSEATEKVLQELKTLVQSNQQALGGISQTVQENNALLQGLQSMQQATMILQGINLAVSVAGFAIVMNKLDKIHRQLERMDAKLSQLQMTADEIHRYQQMIQATYYQANLENLSSGLRTGNSLMVANAIGDLRKSQYLFQTICEQSLSDLYALYKEPSLFKMHFEAAITCALCIANAHAQIDQPEEARLIIEKTKAWQQNIRDQILKPVEQKNRALWIARLKNEERKAIKAILDLQRAMPECLLYLEDTYSLCHKAGLNTQQLFEQQTQRKPLLMEVCPTHLSPETEDVLLIDSVEINNFRTIN